MSDDKDADTRAAFEAWVSAPPFEYDITRLGEASAWPGCYARMEVDLAYHAWKAAAGEIELLSNGIVEWADKVFPDRTPSSAFLKFFREIGELIDDPTKADEYADICIMLFDLAKMHGVDLAAAIRDKMKVNRGRTWAKGAFGTYQHEE